jgi:hypothetical protein
MKNNTLIQYIRDDQYKPYGVVVAVRKDNDIYYGFSIQNKKDRWDRETGVKIAVARANAGEYVLPKSEKLCKCILENFRLLSERAVRYFKDVQNVRFVELSE